ncbi:BON domain-containing protein [Burkholderia anthina]|uniref:BON domain-containing protein n=1 Tax=Burkholderia anthina TaxID=179879 RepID=UPI001CF1A37D|nr:BON domain-containing protein [Burkholderia anthina]MCA8092535.1 BON domain-containing protein [Burkholderia anthina]
MKHHNRIIHGLLLATLLNVAGSAYAQPSSGTAGSAVESASESAATLANAPKSADRKLAHQVATALGRTRGLNATRIVVRVRDGNVTLSGSVPDSEQIPLAVDAAQKVEGVKAVQSVLHISVQPL